jgi:RimJ/RimL family protein N-acetyltransferase
VITDGAWVNDKPYGVIHRIASAGYRKGIASFCMAHCFRLCGNLKIDTHKDNHPMQNALAKNGFVRCGIIYLQNGDERIAFQKTE